MGNRLTPIVRNLLIINLAIFALDLFIREDLGRIFGMKYIESEYFAPWQILTYMFLHANLMHIFSNMLGLFFFGPWLEGVMGSRRFLVFYMVTGIGAGLLNQGVTYVEMRLQESALEEYAANPDPDAFVRYMHRYDPAVYRSKSDLVHDFTDNFEPNASVDILRANFQAKTNSPAVTIGASGAIFGILIAFALIFPNIEMMMLFFPVPIKAKYLVVLFVLYELYSGLNYSGISNVAHYAHLGGALIGFILVKFWGIRRQY